MKRCMWRSPPRTNDSAKTSNSDSTAQRTDTRREWVKKRTAYRFHSNGPERSKEVGPIAHFISAHNKCHITLRTHARAHKHTHTHTKAHVLTCKHARARPERYAEIHSILIYTCCLPRRHWPSRYTHMLAA